MSEFELDYLILGGGAVGCIFGGLLSNSGHNVQIINRSLKTVDSIKTNGLHLDLNGKKINCFPKAGQPGDAMTARVVMVFTKTYQTKDALLGILPKMNSKTTYFSLQNGLGNGKVLSDITHSNSIFHGVTMLPATLLKAGHVKSKGVNTTWFGSYKSAEHNIAHSILHDLIKCDFDVRLVENPNVCLLYTSDAADE